MKRFLSLAPVFGCYVIVFAGIIIGVIPRSGALVAVALIGLWMLLRPLEDGLHFFVRSIPLFIALPITASFDNLTMWRPLSLILMIRYFMEPDTLDSLMEHTRRAIRAPIAFCRAHPVAAQLLALLAIGALSLLGAQYPLIGIKRIIYFTNLSIVPLIIWARLSSKHLSAEQLVRSIAIPTMIVVVVGFLQLISTYLIDVYQFMRLWGEQIQMRQFGMQWSQIAVEVGNTWLAYYGNQLSLRVFSLFPDSHSFPTFILLGMPALLAVATAPIVRIASSVPLKRLVRTYASLSIVWVPLAFLAAILSGTRGIWAASVGVAVLIPLLAWVMRMRGVDIARRRIFAYGGMYALMFFLLFSVAWPIFISPQFLVGKGDLGMFANRIRSVIDFGETSNALRLLIWKSSLTSIVHHPLLGVGIGNFPVVLNQNISLARAGSTAHNLYLHVAAEMGIAAALLAVSILCNAWLAAWRWFEGARETSRMYAASLLLYLPWVYAYVMTDPILFDERVFLLFATTLALVWSHDHA
jgi:hypothetical protein